MKQWKVYYSGTLYGHHGFDHAGKEIPVNKDFLWGDLKCFVPAVYLCGKGLVVDLCIETAPEVYSAFLQKWHPDSPEGLSLTEDQRRQMQLENPMDQHFRCTAEFDGKKLPIKEMSSVYHTPGNAETEVHAAMEHYRLDPSRIWGIYRMHFPWKGRNPKELQTLTLSFSASLSPVTAAIFETPAAPISITHPSTGETFILDVTETDREPLHLHQPIPLPFYCIRMTYRITPDLPANRFLLQDTLPSDMLRMPISQSDDSFGIIGGADGPTAILFNHNQNSNLHMAISSLHYEPVENVTWKFSFLEKPREDISVTIL